MHYELKQPSYVLKAESRLQCEVYAECKELRCSFGQSVYITGSYHHIRQLPVYAFSREASHYGMHIHNCGDSHSYDGNVEKLFRELLPTVGNAAPWGNSRVRELYRGAETANIRAGEGVNGDYGGRAELRRYCADYLRSLDTRLSHDSPCKGADRAQGREKVLLAAVKLTAQMPCSKHLCGSLGTYGVGSYIIVAKPHHKDFPLGQKCGKLLRKLLSHKLIIVGKSAQTAALKGDVKLKNKKVTVDEFNKLFEPATETKAKKTTKK